MRVLLPPLCLALLTLLLSTLRVLLPALCLALHILTSSGGGQQCRRGSTVSLARQHPLVLAPMPLSSFTSTCASTGTPTPLLMSAPAASWLFLRATSQPLACCVRWRPPPLPCAAAATQASTMCAVRTWRTAVLVCGPACLRSVGPLLPPTRRGGAPVVREPVDAHVASLRGD